MKITKTTNTIIPGPLLFTVARFGDDRGYFTEVMRKSDVFGAGLNIPMPTPGTAKSTFRSAPEFVQECESYSHANVLRGLHFQWSPYMGKLIRVAQGAIIDVILDIRPDSETCGHAEAFLLVGKSDMMDFQSLWVPPGFAHGFLSLEPSTVSYLCTGEYSAGSEAGILPTDPMINWKLAKKELVTAFKTGATAATISKKDLEGHTLAKWLAGPSANHFKGLL